MKQIFITLLLSAFLPAIAQEPERIEPPVGDSPGKHLVERIDENAIYDQAGFKIKPQYPGGVEAFYKFISTNLVVPEINSKDDITLKVYVYFIVEKDGTLSGIKALRDPGYGMGAEAVRVISLSEKWSPGIIDEEPVRASFNLPITINIPGTGKIDVPEEGTPAKKPLEKKVRGRQ